MRLVKTVKYIRVIKQRHLSLSRFRRIAVDIMGHLPRTSHGNRFVLVTTDYVICFPETFALQTITANKVAEVLTELFT